MANVTTHVPMAYPTPEDGLHSGQHLISHATGSEVLPTSTLVAHCWVLIGSGLGMAYPADEGVKATATTGPKLTDADRQALEQFVAKCDEAKASGTNLKGAPDWKALIKTVLEILLRFL